MTYETLKVVIGEDRVGLITMNRPEVKNAMNTRMMTELRDLFWGFYVEENAAACLIVTGEGNAFCSGGDLKERRGMTDETWRRQHAIVEQMMRAIMECPIPVIAAVNGAAFAGGMEIALGCDFIYAAQSARFALTEVTLGIMPGGGGTQTIARAVGERRAKELILTGRPFSASEAAGWGLVNAVLSQDELLPAALATAAAIANNAPISVRQAKQSIHRGLQMALRDGLTFEIEAYARMVPTQDRHEGVTAFNEKRPPRFIGK